MKETEYVLAVDLGKRRDYTAIAIVQRTGVYTVRHLQRLPLGTSYTQAAAHIRRLLRRPELLGRCTLVVDATGAGEPVVDLLRASDLPCPLKPVLITAGHAAHQTDGYYFVPKRDLILALEVMLENEELRVVRSLDGTPSFLEEMLAMKASTSGRGFTSYEAREGDHDDLVMAVAMACWWLRRRSPWVGEVGQRLL